MQGFQIFLEDEIFECSVFVWEILLYTKYLQSNQ